SLDELRDSACKSYLIITDKIIDDDLMDKAVVYRPKSLVVGIGLHYNTSKEDISKGIKDTFAKYNLALKSIRLLATVDKGIKVKGLEEYAKEHNLEIKYFSKEELAKVQVPNPSEIVKKYEKTASVSEAAAILASNGKLVVEKQKYPPNLTIAVARVNYE
ncbi:MAG: precorrin-3B C(17)-methyltransferase, partial [Candidatus Nitrosothermus koennekii]